MLPVTSLGKLIARGRTAEIYAWNAGYVLKLFFDCWPADRVDYEARMARAVHASGLPVPAVGEIVEIRGRLGVLFERVDGPTMLQTLAAEPRRLPPCARLLAELHADMHSNSISLGLPLQRRRLADKIQTAEVLSNRLREAALKALETLPDGDRLCHGDFHPGNVIMTVRGPMLIDWPDATCGHPLADVARTSLLLTLAALPSGTVASERLAIEEARQQFHRIYLEHYFQLRPDNQHQLSAWLPLIAAARLSEHIPEEKHQIVAMVETSLSSQD